MFTVKGFKKLAVSKATNPSSLSAGSRNPTNGARRKSTAFLELQAKSLGLPPEASGKLVANANAFLSHEPLVSTVGDVKDGGGGFARISPSNLTQDSGGQGITGLGTRDGSLIPDGPIVGLNSSLKSLNNNIPVETPPFAVHVLLFGGVGYYYGKMTGAVIGAIAGYLLATY